VYVSSAGLSKPREDNITKSHYFRVMLHGNIVYLNVAEKTRRLKDGRTRKDRFLYSVTDKIK